MRYPSPVPTQRADYKSAEVKAIALWSRERWCLAYHHRIERNRVYLTACSVACVLCILFAMRRREGQGGAPHKMIGPSDGGRRRLLYRLYFNADRTCNTKEKKRWIEIRTSRAQPKLFMGGENFPFFSYGSGIDFLWYPKRLGLSVLIWNLCKTDQTFFLAFDTSFVVGTWQRYGRARGTEDIPLDPTYRHLLSSHVALSSARAHSATPLWKSFVGKRGNGKFFSPRRVCRFGFLFFFLLFY